MGLRLITRKGLVRLLVLFVALTAAVGWGWHWLVDMRGPVPEGLLETMSEAEQTLESMLRTDVEKLASKIGERNVLYRYDALVETEEFLAAALSMAGYPQVERVGYEVEGRTCNNLAVELRGSKRASEIVVVGAHYDTVPGCPGANDNGTGVAATLALARRFAGEKPSRTLRFVAFVNEEPPFFQTESMGSLVYARRCRERGDDIVAMLSLETMGCYLDGEGTQKYPMPFGLIYPSTGNFIGFVGNLKSRKLVEEVTASFRRHSKFPSERGSLPSFTPGVGWSDHWSFWQAGYAAIMVTDTAPFRYEQYHTPQDTTDRIQFDRLARVVEGLAKVIDELANPAAPD